MHEGDAIDRENVQKTIFGRIAFIIVSHTIESSNHSPIRTKIIHY